MIEGCHYLRVRTFDMFNISKQPTIIVEVDVVRQRLVLRREVGSTVFQEPPFHSIFIFLFFPPDEKEANKRVKTYLETLIFFTRFLSDDGCRRDVLGQWKMKGMAFPNHLQRLCSSSSFFLIFSCLASSISPFVLFGFLQSLLSSRFTLCAKNSIKNYLKLHHSDLSLHET